MSILVDHAEFLAAHRSAAMITIAADGTPRAVRVGVALVDGKLWSSGTQGRVRTRRLRRDPRCTVFVFDTGGFSWLGLDTTVTILAGPGAAELNLRLFRVMQDRPAGPLSWFGAELGEEAFLARMREEERLIYEFGVHRAYGPG
jgi:PPOX class probable F420-dependent enzyme